MLFLFVTTQVWLSPKANNVVTFPSHQKIHFFDAR